MKSKYPVLRLLGFVYLAGGVLALIIGLPLLGIAILDLFKIDLVIGPGPWSQALTLIVLGLLAIALSQLVQLLFEIRARLAVAFPAYDQVGNPPD